MPNSFRKGEMPHNLEQAEEDWYGYDDKKGELKAEKRDTKELYGQISEAILNDDTESFLECLSNSYPEDVGQVLDKLSGKLSVSSFLVDLLSRGHVSEVQKVLPYSGISPAYIVKEALSDIDISNSELQVKIRRAFYPRFTLDKTDTDSEKIDAVIDYYIKFGYDPELPNLVPEKLQTAVVDRCLDLMDADTEKRNVYLGYRIVESLSKWKGLDKKLLSEKLITKKDNLELLLSEMENFKDTEVDEELLIEKVLEFDLGDNLLRAIKFLHKTDHLALAKRLVKSGLGYEGAVAANLKNLKNLDNELAEQLIKARDRNVLEVLAVVDKIPNFNLEMNVELTSFPEGITLKNLYEIYRKPVVGLRVCQSLSNMSNYSYKKHILPILASQGEAAFLYLHTMQSIRQEKLDEAAKDYFTYIAKKHGTRARNILENIVLKVDSIEQERDTVESFIEEIGIFSLDLYGKYRKIKSLGDTKSLQEMKEMTAGLQEKIYKGELNDSDFEDPLYPAVSYHTFPPAIGLTQDQYNGLNKQRPDRHEDVPTELDDIQYQKFEVRTGKYLLGEGEELELEQWDRLSEAIKKVNADVEKVGKVNIDKSLISEKLMQIYTNGTHEKAESQEFLFEAMYRYHLSIDGGRLESGFEISIPGLMKYKEFIGDRIKNDLIKDCVEIWKEGHGAKYESLKTDVLNRLKNSQAKNFATVSNMLKQIRKHNEADKKQTAITKLDEFLKNFGLSYETIKDRDAESLKQDLEVVTVEYMREATEENYRTDEYYNSPEFIAAYDTFMAKRDPDMLVLQKISSDFVAPINKQMRKEVDKFKFEEQMGGAENVTLEFAVSKKKEHGVAGYNMGVCVAPDEELWNDTTFQNCIIFDPEKKQAMGGMHFLGREGNLCLPGINPSLELLNSVDNVELFNQMIAYAKEVKDRLGLNKLLIPIDPSIHSNRTQFQEIIRTRNYPKIFLKAVAPFSYAPHEYSFRECYEVS